MKSIGYLIRLVLLVLNILVAVGFLISAYSTYIYPVEHPVWSCTGLFFPFFIVGNVGFLLLWLCMKQWYALLPLFTLGAGWGSLSTYFPLGTAREPQGDVIKLLTYNTQGIAAAKEYSKEDGNPVLNYLAQSNADIICLQEFTVSGKIKQKEVDRILSSYPYHKQVQIEGGSGLACYSRYPILSGKRIDYPSKYNGSALFRLKVGEDTLVLINNHLESNKLDMHDKEMYNDMLKSPGEANVKSSGKHLLHKLAEAAAIRAPQADSVARVIERHPTPYILVCGDFNDSPVSYAHRVIGEGLTDAYAEAGAGPGFTYNQNHFYFRIDHIFAGSGFRVLQCKVDRSIRASDHYPVWCLLEKK